MMGGISSLDHFSSGIQQGKSKKLSLGIINPVGIMRRTPPALTQAEPGFQRFDDI